MNEKHKGGRAHTGGKDESTRATHTKTQQKRHRPRRATLGNERTAAAVG